MYGAIRLEKSEGVMFYFQESCSTWRFNLNKMYLIVLAKTCPICRKIDSQVHALLELSLCLQLRAYPAIKPDLPIKMQG